MNVRIPGCVVLLLLAASALAQNRPVAGDSRSPMVTPNAGSFNLVFPDTKVGDTSYEPCYYFCFEVTNGKCDGNGTAVGVQPPSLPFRAGNFRLGRFQQGCGGTPVTLPKTLGPGDVILVDFEFSPVAAGLFQGSAIYTYSVGPSTTDTFTFNMSGKGISNANVSVSAFPRGMLQEAGAGGGVDRYLLTNSGTEATTLTLSQTGDFFTQAPTSFQLAPGASQAITITGLPRAAGEYSGTSTVRGNGIIGSLQIPIRLLVASAPSGSVTPVASSSRTDVSGPPSSNPTGSVSIGNHGSSTLRGVVSSDAAWLVPGSTSMTINPGATGTLQFSIDRSKRPDGDSPFGSVAGALSVSYLKGSSGKGLITPTAGSVPTVASFPVVDTAASTGSKVAIPSIAAGETAFFIPGVVSRTGIVTDFFLTNVGTTLNLGNIRVYYTSATKPPNSAPLTTVGQIPPYKALAMGDISKTLFGAAAETGALQIRAGATDSLTLNAVLWNLSSSGGSFGTALPVARGDKAVAAGSALVLPGVRKDAGTRTDLLIQETSGAAATVSIDFLSSTGAVVSTRQSDAVGSFSLLELQDVVPSGAVAARVTNKAGSSGKIFATAVAKDTQSGDAWTITPSAGGAVALPYVISKRNGSEVTTTAVTLTNLGNSTASATVRFNTTATKRRGIRRGTGTASAPLVEPTSFQETISLAPSETRTIADAPLELFSATGASGSITVTPVTGNIAVSGQIAKTDPGVTGSYGTAVPALSVAEQVKSGGRRSFAGIEDASATTIAAGTPGTYRSMLGLAEVGGKSAAVRVTLRYSYTSGLVAAFGTAIKDVALAANGYVLLDQIASAILGESRGSLGDLHNMQVEVAVTSGEGTVLPFIVESDNGNGDLVLRTN